LKPLCVGALMRAIEPSRALGREHMFFPVIAALTTKRRLSRRFAYARKVG